MAPKEVKEHGVPPVDVYEIIYLAFQVVLTTRYPPDGRLMTTQ